MGGNTNYDTLAVKSHKKTLKTTSEKILDSAGNFPNCKGLYPDCPENPSLKEKACRNCPKTEDIEPDEIED
jgi:hypothetical protein